MRFYSKYFFYYFVLGVFSTCTLDRIERKIAPSLRIELSGIDSLPMSTLKEIHPIQDSVIIMLFYPGIYKFNSINGGVRLFSELNREEISNHSFQILKKYYPSHKIFPVQPSKKNGNQSNIGEVVEEILSSYKFYTTYHSPTENDFFLGVGLPFNIIENSTDTVLETFDFLIKVDAEFHIKNIWLVPFPDSGNFLPSLNERIFIYQSKLIIYNSVYKRLLNDPNPFIPLFLEFILSDYDSVAQFKSPSSICYPQEQLTLLKKILNDDKIGAGAGGFNIKGKEINGEYFYLLENKIYCFTQPNKILYTFPTPENCFVKDFLLNINKNMDTIITALFSKEENKFNSNKFFYLKEFHTLNSDFEKTYLLPETLNLLYFDFTGNNKFYCFSQENRNYFYYEFNW